jgi:predicted nucleotidyltransferase
VEWIQSPIIYKELGSFRERARALLPHVYSVERGMHHYRSMAKTNFRGYLRADLVPLKKYFYVLRPLLSVRWLLEFQRPAPIEFNALLQMIDNEPSLRLAIDRLLELKSRSPEMGLAEQIPEIQRFIESELDRQESLAIERDDRSDVAPLLSELFRDVLRETWE